MSDVKKELVALMEIEGINQSTVAKALDISSGTLSQYLSGSYPGNLTKIEEGIKAFLELRREKRKTQKHILPFVKTSVAKKFYDVCRMVHTEQDMGVAYGPSGVGKTSAAKEYTRLNPKTILIEADAGYTARDLMRELHRKFGDGRGTIHEMFEDVVTKISPDRLIIVDEAENLPTRALELLRRIHDKAGIGILLCGMPRLLANLRGKRNELAQLYSRIGVAANLQMISEHDTDEIVHAVIPNSNGLAKVFHSVTNGNTRTLCKLLRQSMRVAGLNGVAINESLVRATAELLII
jgi:DNA transposition AAA+ family ATPase